MPFSRSCHRPPFYLALTAFLLSVLEPPLRADEILIDFEGGFPISKVETRDTKIELTEDAENQALQLATGHKAPWPGITLVPEDAPRDLSHFEYVTVDVTNKGDENVSVSLRMDSPRLDGKDVFDQAGIEIAPHQTETIKLKIKRHAPQSLTSKLFGMRGNPGGLRVDTGVDPTKIAKFLVFVSHPEKDHCFSIDNLRAGGMYHVPDWLQLDADAFFPMIDKYGQFLHAEWPNKVTSEADLQGRIAKETNDLKQHPGPADWDQYGGWSGGPQLETTGFFRSAKRQGKWWLVDPDGHLFWSHGSDCVRSSTAYTPITDREFYFAELPKRVAPWARFYGKGHWAPHGYYNGKGGFATFNFTGSNLLRKYGDDWEARFAELCHRRLRSWGMNSIGNWSSRSIYSLQKTPYVATVGSGGKRLEGSEGYWGKFADVFDPSFRESLQQKMAAEKHHAANDPWCIGFFVDNELAWGDELSLAEATLASPPDQAAKRVFVEDLKAKYATIEKLNDCWNTEHASWDALLECRTSPDKKRAHDDLAEFYTKTAEAYFRACRDAVKKITPNTLYLGCRFAWVNDRAVRAAAKYCDVVSFNRYRYSVADLDLPEGVDKPVLIGEFHFGALDRGMFHTGLKPVDDQEARGQAYADYVRGALENPYIVGTHWFQFGDQATTGRNDGENYQIGLLDVCDTPYPETIVKVREVGYQLYSIRSAQDQ